MYLDEHIVRKLGTVSEVVALQIALASRLPMRSIERIEILDGHGITGDRYENCLLYTSPSPRDRQKSRMPSSA